MNTPACNGSNPLVFNKDLREKIKQAKVLVVGAGGIGCELLKNLVLTGFQDIEIIDLDTIDVSNLNRQFLFHKKHVGMPKAHVARDSVLQFNPKAKVIAHHASITSAEFGVSYIQKFNMVLNALDNRNARNHVNRLCLAGRVPLIESGTEGYTGQVELILKDLTACYECTEKSPQKTYPGCTIRNTPSELIHCIVWAKHLFNQLFGQHDPSAEDEDVSPDPTDGEVSGDGNVIRVETRVWAKEINYNAPQIFKKLFVDDINTLLAMKHLWEKRRPPVPITLEEAMKKTRLPPQRDLGESKMREELVLSMRDYAKLFTNCIEDLRCALKQSNHGYLEWDKDDKCAMEFVVAAANIRGHIFGITQKSMFEIKTMAGNIIPAIATSNAAIAGLIVLQAVNVVRGELTQCQSVYLRNQVGPRGVLISREVSLVPRNSKCQACSEKPTVTIATDLNKMKLKDFETLVLRERLNMIEPEVILVRTGNMILSSEEGETDNLKEKTLMNLGAFDGAILEADDFLQNFKILIVVKQRRLSREDPPYFILDQSGDLTPKEESNGTAETQKAGPSKEEDDDDDLQMILEGEAPPDKRAKRKLDEQVVPVKRMKTDDTSNSDDANVVVL